MTERLKKGSKFRYEHFDSGSEPDLRTIRAWVIDGRLPGRIINGHPYIDMDRYEIEDYSLLDRINNDAAAA